MTEKINLSSLKLNHFTTLDAEMYYKLLKINPDNITWLYLDYNNLTDISGINIFKNLIFLNLNDNPINDLTPLKNLINLNYLSIHNLNLTDELKTVKILKSLPYLEFLNCKNIFKIVDIRNELKEIKIND